PLAKLLEKVEPSSAAKYVAFQTLYDPKRMPNQLTGVLDWPYVEGLRLDEAMHPLTILATGLYGETLPPKSRPRPGTFRRQTSTGFIPTLIPTFRIHAGARRRSTG